MKRTPYIPSARDRARRDEDAQFGKRFVGQPTVGFYRLRLVKGGPFVGARILYGPTPDPDDADNVMDRSPLWRGEVDGALEPNPSPQPTDAVWRIYERGERIDEATFRFLLAEADWCRSHRPDEPIADPRRPIDMMKTPTPF